MINVGDICIHKHYKTHVIIIYKKEKFLHYKEIIDGTIFGILLGWPEDDFVKYYIFSEKLTNEQTIRNIIE